MKYALALLLSTLGAIAYAQPVYRCVDRLGHIAYQDKLCTQQLGEGSTDPVRPKISPVQNSSIEQTDTGTSDWNQQQRKQQRLQATVKTHAETVRVRMLLQTLNDQKTTEYAENHRRCEKAKRVATLCGKYSGMFSCDEKGFRRESITEVSTLKPAIFDNGSAYEIEQCLLRAANGGR